MPELPTGYLTGGYFETVDGKKYVKTDYIIRYPKTLAGLLQQEGNKLNKSSQLRKFYDFCVRLESILAKHDSFKEIEASFVQIVPYVNNAKTRGLVSYLFVQFVEKNVALVKDKQSFSAFMKHFEALIAYMPKDTN